MSAHHHAAEGRNAHCARTSRACVERFSPCSPWFIYVEVRRVDWVAITNWMFGRLWKICAILVDTISSSMAVSSWFNRFDGNLPQVLFYARIFADLLGRPATLCAQPSVNTMGALAGLRLIFVPYFFLVIFRVFPTARVFLITGVLGFSFLSGYIVTLCYQVAPQLVPNTNNATKLLTKLLNVCFGGAVLFGLLSSLALSDLQ